MKVLVLGAGGLLGTTLIPAFGAMGHTVVAHGRNGVGLEPGDLTQAAETLALVARTAPDVVVNLAGLTDVDRCEAEPQQAWLANVLTAENVGAACGACACGLGAAPASWKLFSSFTGASRGWAVESRVPA